MEERRRLGLLWGGVAAGIVVLSPVLTRLIGVLPRCPFKWLTGLPCPGCGTSRAALALARVDVLHALYLNPLTSLGMLALVAGGLVAGVFALANRPLPDLWDGRITVPQRAALGIALLGNWIWLVATGR